jgi:hypothetical protein
MRPQYVQQPRQHALPMPMLVLVAVGAMDVVVRAMAVAVPIVVSAIMAVMRVAARNVHAIQNAAKNSFPHVTSHEQMQFWRNNE